MPLSPHLRIRAKRGASGRAHKARVRLLLTVPFDWTCPCPDLADKPWVEEIVVVVYGRTVRRWRRNKRDWHSPLAVLKSQGVTR